MTQIPQYLLDSRQNSINTCWSGRFGYLKWSFLLTFTIFPCKFRCRWAPNGSWPPHSRQRSARSAETRGDGDGEIYLYIIILLLLYYYYSKIVQNHDYFIIFYVWDINSNSSFFSMIWGWDCRVSCLPNHSIGLENWQSNWDTWYYFQLMGMFFCWQLNHFNVTIKHRWINQLTDE